MTTPGQIDEGKKQTLLSWAGAALAAQQTKGTVLQEESKRIAHENLSERIWLNAFFAALTELLFVALPFIVIAIIQVYRGHYRSFFYVPEWSIVASVIGGQTVVKFLKAISHIKEQDTDRVLLAVSALIVLLLIPDLALMTIVLLSPSMSLSLAVAQVALFGVSLLAFCLACFFERGLSAEREHKIL
jgi:hypothetical protein